MATTIENNGQQKTAQPRTIPLPIDEEDAEGIEFVAKFKKMSVEPSKLSDFNSFFFGTW